MSPPETSARQLQGITALYSLLWLFAANLGGLWLSILLLWPETGRILGEFSYGRWMPLHMDWQLYGWCSLPLVGLLIRYFAGSTPDVRSIELHLPFLLWSLGLAVLGAASLNGYVSGKLFLNWEGFSRGLFPAAQVFLWVLLAGWSWARYRRVGHFDTTQWMQAALLFVLIAAPLSLFLTSGPKGYPPVDPASGGATGHSLLASSLGIIFIFGLIPGLLRLESRVPAARWGRRYAIAFVASAACWALLGHGNEANTQVGQILGLGVLLAWVPLVLVYYRSFVWPSGIRRWLLAFLFWWALLTVSGFITFLPGILDRLKFTNGLVAHAHLAMAGMLTAFNMLVLAALGRTGKGDPWSDRAGFWLWHGGTLLYVVSMTLQGMREGGDPAVLFGPDRLTDFFYGLRLFSGVMMTAASLRWLWLLEGVRRGATSPLVHKLSKAYES